MKVMVFFERFQKGVRVLTLKSNVKVAIIDLFLYVGNFGISVPLSNTYHTFFYIQKVYSFNLIF